jgi:tRNA dimethylallyltransferase
VADKTVPPLLVIVGETASGKSTLAMELAKQLDGEIICADSWTVYKGFDIGTAKPSALERAEIPHHLLDVADARGGFNTVMFQQLAEAAIAGIQARGHLPILVGGTGLYIDSIIYDYQFLPPTSPELRQELNRLSLSELLERAKQQGLETGHVDIRNKRRVIRLIENDGKLPSKKPLRPNTLILGLQTLRGELRQRIEQRVDTMLEAGLEAEVRRLAEEYGWYAEPMKGIGYKEWLPYLLGTQDMATTRQNIIKNSLDLAKRQRTWFKRNSSIQWLNNRDDLQQIVALVTTDLHKL